MNNFSGRVFLYFSYMHRISHKGKGKGRWGKMGPKGKGKGDRSRNAEFPPYIQSARTHARTETEIDFPVGLTPPNLRFQYIPIYRNHIWIFWILMKLHNLFKLWKENWIWGCRIDRRLRWRHLWLSGYPKMFNIW